MHLYSGVRKIYLYHGLIHDQVIAACVALHLDWLIPKLDVVEETLDVFHDKIEELRLFPIS